MAKRKRKTSGRSTASRRKNRTQDRMPAGLITLFAGLVLMALAFVPGSSAWRTMHDVLFGVFGCGSFVLGAALCYLAILYTRGEDLLPHIAKLVLGLIFASGTVIVFSDIPTDQTAAQMTAACYHNGMSAWLSGGALGAVLGGTLLLLCGRPAANLVMAALAACASLYIFDVTPAECWQWLCNVGGSVHEKGLAVHDTAGANGHDLCHLGLLFGAAGQDEAALGGLLDLNSLDNNTVCKRNDLHRSCPPIINIKDKLFYVPGGCALPVI